MSNKQHTSSEEYFPAELQDEFDEVLRSFNIDPNPTKFLSPNSAEYQAALEALDEFLKLEGFDMEENASTYKPVENSKQVKLEAVNERENSLASWESVDVLTKKFDHDLLGLSKLKIDSILVRQGSDNGMPNTKPAFPANDISYAEPEELGLWSIPNEKQFEEQQSPQVHEQRSPPVIEEQTHRVKEEQSPRVHEEQSPRVYEEQSFPVKEEKSPRVYEEQSSPVNEEQSPPVNEEQSPPVNEEQSPPVNEEQSPPVNEEQSPPVNEEQSPQVHEQQSPQVHEQQSPQVHEQQSPQVHAEQTHRVNEEQSPQVHEQQSPSDNEEQSLQVHEQQSPPVHEQQSPQVHEQQSPPVNEEQSPQVNEEQSPQVFEQQSPSDNEEQSPQVHEEQSPPILEQQFEFSLALEQQYEIAPVLSLQVTPEETVTLPEGTLYPSPTIYILTWIPERKRKSSEVPECPKISKKAKMQPSANNASTTPKPKPARQIFPKKSLFGGEPSTSSPTMTTTPKCSYNLRYRTGKNSLLPESKKTANKEAKKSRKLQQQRNPSNPAPHVQRRNTGKGERDTEQETQSN